MSSSPRQPSVFISHSNKDKELVAKLAAGLAEQGLDTLYDDKLLGAGQQWRNELLTAITEADCVVVLITRDSVASSNTMGELGIARKMMMDADSGKLLIPVVYGDAQIPLFISDVQAVFWKDNDREVIHTIAFAVHEAAAKRRTFSVAEDEDNADANTAESNGSALKRKRSARKSSTAERAANEKFIASSRQYWLIKMGAEWKEDELNEGKTIFFRPKDYKGQPLDEQVPHPVQPGDYALAFLSGIRQHPGTYEGYPGDYLWGEMHVGSLIEHTTSQSVRLQVAYTFHRPIPLHRFRELLPNSNRSLGPSSPYEAIIPISEDTYHAILALEEQPFTNTLLPFYLTEGNHRVTEDQLGFEADIDSFANVICLDVVKPPLAIGLFGNWGSGKSFFMEKLEGRIEKLSGSGYPEFVRNVVPVRFNSWHYSDTNLWASMIVHIFKSLNDYATAKLEGDKTKDAVKSIYEQLSITKSEIAAVDAKIKAKSAEVDALEAQKTVVEKTLHEQRATLAGWKAGEVMQAVFSDPYIRRDLAALNAELGTQPLTDNIEAMRARLDDLAVKTVEQKDAWTALVRNKRGKWVLVLLLAALFAVLCFVVRGMFLQKLRDVVGELTAASAVLLSGLGVLWKWFDRGSKQVRALYGRLDSLMKTVEQKKSEKELEGEAEKKALESSISRLDAETAALEQQKAQAMAAQAALETELEDISSGKRLADFLAQKTSDDNYARQLGIISWIREDLKSLNDHFDRQRKAREAGEISTTPQLQIDRIVLYIDDLDRCNEDVVVKVLEAIHLLLAFPLFVVVVGVDPRWLNNALTEKYKRLFGGAGRAEGRDGLAGNDDEAPLGGVASSYDYLEKIFQIPFALKPMTKTGREDLLRYLVKDELQKDSKEEPKGFPFIFPYTFADPQESTSDSEHETANASETNSELQEISNHKTKERLVISGGELAYMQQLSGLFAHTPRTANRYVNIYRLIKAHGGLQVSGPYEIDEFAPILFLLAVVVGYPECADDFIARIAEAADTESCGDFLDGCGIEPLREKAKEVMGALSAMELRCLKKNLPLVARFSFRTLMKNPG